MYPWNRNYSLYHYFAALKGGEKVGDFIANSWIPNFQRLCLEGGNHSGGPTGSEPQSLPCQMAKQEAGNVQYTASQMRNTLSNN